MVQFWRIAYNNLYQNLLSSLSRMMQDTENPIAIRTYASFVINATYY